MPHDPLPNAGPAPASATTSFDLGRRLLDLHAGIASVHTAAAPQARDAA